MADASRGLQEQETGVGIGEVQPPAAELAPQPVVIEGRVGAEQGQAKAATPLYGSVAGAAVATQSAEHRRDVPAEPWRFRGRAIIRSGSTTRAGNEQCPKHDQVGASHRSILWTDFDGSITSTRGSAGPR